MENLSRENTWEKFEEMYPRAMKNFHEWIDAYKIEVGWTHLFNPKYISVHISGHAETKLTKDAHPKFHDLPIEMQVGILAKWLEDFNLSGYDKVQSQWLLNHGVSLKGIEYPLEHCFQKLEYILRKGPIYITPKN